MQPLQLDRVLAIRPDLRAETVDGQSVFLLGERQRLVFADPRVVRIASLIDGKRAVHQILSDAGPEIAEAEVLFILDHLAARGYVVEAAPELPAERAAFWHGLGLDARRVATALDQVPVRVQALGPPSLGAWMADALRQIGARLDDRAKTQIIVTDDGLRPELARIDAEARRDGISWFLAQPVGTRPLLGPLFRPRTGPCWVCLAFWLRNNRPVEELLRRRKDARIVAPAGVVEACARAACNLAALTFVRATAAPQDAATPAAAARIVALDLATFETSRHAVVRRPQCPACGDPSRTAAIGERPIALAPVPKRHCSDGGYRGAAPEETWARYAHLVSPICGPVSYVVPVPERNTELRAVYASGYLISPRAAVPGTNRFDKMCAGKGRTAAQAKTSALCEALERFCGVWQGDEAHVHATANQLGPQAILPAALTNFSAAQAQKAAEVPPAATDRNRVLLPLGGDIAIDWSPAWSVSRNERRYVPLAYCYAEAPAEAGTAFSDPCGNGVAAGTCREEAILQGLLELIERDAVALWWYNRVARPGVALDSFAEPYFRALRDDYATLGWTLWALDLTHDLGIPTFAALAHHPAEDRFAIGFGCHLDARLGLQRALTEVNQLFDPAAARRAPWDLERVSDRGYLFPDPGSKPAEAARFSARHAPDLRADVETCLESLHAADLELLVVDKTRPDLGLTVIQTIVPGLRHFWPRFGPGRLYDVPHALGWVRAPLKENDLNPVSLLV